MYWYNIDTVSIQYRYCIDTVSILYQSIRYRCCIDIESKCFRYCMDTTHIPYRYCVQTGGSKMAPRCTNAPKDVPTRPRITASMEWVCCMLRFGTELLYTRKLQIHLHMIIPTDDFAHFSGNVASCRDEHRTCTCSARFHTLR